MDIATSEADRRTSVARPPKARQRACSKKMRGDRKAPGERGICAEVVTTSELGGAFAESDEWVGMQCAGSRNAARRSAARTARARLRPDARANVWRARRKAPKLFLAETRNGRLNLVSLLSGFLNSRTKQLHISSHHLVSSITLHIISIHGYNSSYIIIYLPLI